MSPTTSKQSALIVGVGLIGGSIGQRLRESGWRVVGRDHSSGCLERALAVGAIDSIAPDGFVADIDLTFVATPVGAIADEVALALQDTDGLVTDVGSVKTPLLSLMSNPRFIGGHPKCGAEQKGVEGAPPEFF